MNKTVHQSLKHCNWILSLALISLFLHVFVILLTFANDDVPTYCFLFSQNCMITLHHANTRGSRLKGAQLRVARIGVLEMNVIHVSCLIPRRT